MANLNRDAASAPEHYKNYAVAETAVLVNAGKCNLYGYVLENNHATEVVYLQLFDAAAAADVTVGTTTPALALMVPAGPDGVIWPIESHPVKHFTKGIVAAVTKTSRTGNTAPTTAASVNLFFSQQ